MADPPATAAADLLPDPVATSTNTVECSIVDNSEIVCTPTGSVEVSTQSFATSNSDEENENIREHIEPPGSFLRRDMVRYKRRSKTPTTEQQVSEPLMAKSEENRTSPILNLPLPPTDSLRKYNSGDSATAHSTPNSVNSKSAMLARKAERYSSLKKRKGPNGLLNRLFCSSPSEGGSSERDLGPKERIRSNSKSPRSRRERIPSEDDEGSCGDCIQLLSGAKDSLTLHNEELVRMSVQESIVDMGCGPTRSSSPQTVVVSKPFHKIGNAPSCDDSSPGLVPDMKLVGEAAVGSSGRKKTSSRRKTTHNNADEESIATPKMRLSMTSYTDDIASTSSRVETPKKSKKKRLKTPSGLVIPSPFANSAKAAFPTALENTRARSTVHRSPPRPTEKANRKSSPNGKVSKRKERSPMGMSLTMSTVSTADTSQTSVSGKLSEEASSPPELIRIASSVEDLSTVPEASVSKEKSGEDDQLTSNRSSGSGSDEMLAKVQEELRDELLEDTDISQPPLEAVSVEAVCAEMADEEAQNEENFDDQTLVQLRDEVDLANRLAQMRLLEIERLEKTMDEMRERQVEESDLLTMKERLDKIEEEKKIAVEQAKKEMEVLMQQKILAINLAKDDDEEKKEEEESMVADDLVDPTMSDTIKKLKQEVSALKAKYEGEGIESRQSSEVVILSSSKEDGVELMRVKKELAEVTEKLAQASFSSRESVTDDGSSELDEKSGKPPLGSSSSKSTISKKTPKKFDILQREKESLRSQISLMEEQAMTVAAEHEQALSDLRKAGELEIERLMNEMEGRMQKQLEKERELKETLSEANSSEKEELLEKIDKLQSEKSSDRSFGLREVQRKEDLVRQIEAMEKREKELLDLHDQSLQDLRTKNELDMSKLHEKIEDLNRSNSESFDITEAAATIDRMTKKLEEERELSRKLKAAVEAEEATNRELTERIGGDKRSLRELSQKIEEIEALKESDLTNLKGQMDAAIVEAGEKTKQAVEALQAAEKISESQRKEAEAKVLLLQTENQRLQSEVEERCAVEDAMQITSNENDELREKVDQLTSQLVTETKSLNTSHQEAIQLLEKDYLQKLGHARNEGVRQLVEVEASHKSQLEAKELKWRQDIDNLTKLSRQKEQDLEQRIVELKSDFQNRLEVNKKESVESIDGSSKRISILEMEIKSKDKALVAARSDKKSAETSARQELDRIKVTLVEREAQLREVSESHNKQFEELLLQLDGVEAEHQETLVSKEQQLAEKETIIQGLGAQLHDAQNKLKETERNLVIEQEKSFALQRRCSDLDEQLKSAKSDLLSLNERHTGFVQEAAILKEKACEEAREEMIEKAESQFQQANEHYVKLRKQYDDSQIKLKKLEVEQRATKKKMERLSKEKESCEVDLKAELAVLHAASAKTEADAAQRVKEYRRQLDHFQGKLEDNEKHSGQLEYDLSKAIAANVELNQKYEARGREYEEMRALSEELMAMVEARDN